MTARAESVDEASTSLIRGTHLLICLSDGWTWFTPYLNKVSYVWA